MPLEAEAVVSAFGLRPASHGPGGRWVGRVGGSEITALHCGMGPPSARAMTLRAVDEAEGAGRPVDHVMVVGICGGLRDELDVGTLVHPEVVVDYATGATFRHRPPGSVPGKGALFTTPEVILDPAATGRMVEGGGVGVDMESSAVAEVCQERGLPWSAHRCISDRAVDGLLDPRVLALTHPDGSIDGEAVGRLLEAEPELADRLARLGRDTALAAGRAAEAARVACLSLDA
jgi:adenosylhomocysteine nucleosidase